MSLLISFLNKFPYKFLISGSRVKLEYECKFTLSFCKSDSVDLSFIQQIAFSASSIVSKVNSANLYFLNSIYYFNLHST